MIGNKKNKFKDAVVWEVARYWSFSPELQLEMLNLQIESHKQFIKAAEDNETRSMLFEALSFLNVEKKRVETTLKDRGSLGLQDSNFNNFIIYNLMILSIHFLKCLLLITPFFLLYLAVKVISG